MMALTNALHRIGNLIRDLTAPSDLEPVQKGTWFYQYVPPHAVGRVGLLDINLVNQAWFVKIIKDNLPRVAAYTTFEKPPIDCLLSDIDVFVTEVVLPRERATRWLAPYRHLLARHKIAVVFTSQVPMKEFCTVAKLDGWQPSDYCHFLEKPWDVPTLLEVIRSCLKRKLGDKIDV